MPSSKVRSSFWEHDHCLPLSRDLAPSSIFEHHRDYICFDLETKDLAPKDSSLENLSKLGVSVACAWDSKEQKMLTFFEQDLGKLVKLCRERLVVGYNIRRFDLPVLTGYGLKLDNLDVFDLMDEVERGLGRKWIKLEYVAQGTLNEGKSADGLMAIEWYKQGKWDLLAEYCARDVEVTHKIFRHGLEKKFLAVQFPEQPKREFSTDWV
ncbi:MAG: ribonuclease H-like domain-containing protein [Bdellovibrionales bacterium]|nr:ribonuclease H-like domain-containing protein [Bdellovibrionales bacterium]